MTSNTAQTETASAPAEKNKPHKKASTGARGANVASPRAKTGKKASRSKRAPKGAKKGNYIHDYRKLSRQAHVEPPTASHSGMDWHGRNRELGHAESLHGG